MITLDRLVLMRTLRDRCHSKLASQRRRRRRSNHLVLTSQPHKKRCSPARKILKWASYAMPDDLATVYCWYVPKRLRFNRSLDVPLFTSKIAFIAAAAVDGA